MLLPMKLFAVLMFVFTCGLSASTLAQQERVNLDLKDVSLNELCSEIQRQTSLYFMFNSEQVRQLGTISVKAVGETVESVLRRVLAGTGLTFEFDGSLIVIAPAPDEDEKEGKDTPEKFTVTGTVKDVDGVTMPGVTIQVKGTTLGFVTDSEGKFDIDLPKRDSLVLIFSFVGYQKREEPVDEKTKVLNVTMKVDIAEIDEVVVTGIFNKPKESFTGAVKYITKDDIMAFGNRNLLQTLNNIDPSFVIRENNTYGSNPNVLPEIQIRGISSLPDITNLQTYARAELNQPLFILDGFEVTLERVMDLNPADVESVTIMKDASSTALYGSRGANGVVVITSSKPRQGKLRISFTAGLNLEIPDLSSYNLLNAREKLELEERAGMYDDPSMQALYVQNSRAVAEGVDTYWIGKPVRTGVGQQYMLSMGGGDESFRYTMNLSYNTVAGAMKGSYRNNFNGSLTISYLLEKIRFSNTFSLGLNNSAESPYGSFDAYVSMNPYYYPWDEDGRLVPYFYTFGSSNNITTVVNPMYDASLNTFDEEKYTNLQNTFRVEYDIIKGLKVGVSVGYSHQTSRSDEFTPASASDFFMTTDPDAMGSYNWGYGENRRWSLDFTAQYGNTFGRHSVYAGVNATLQDTENDSYLIWVRGFSNDRLTDISNAAGFATDRPTATDSKSRLAGFVLTGNYNYDSRYFLDFSYRLDGASSFGANNRFAPFWSVGVGYTVSQERFVQENAPWINLMRLRYSYGVTSSLPVDTYQSLTTYEYDEDQRWRSDMGAMLLGIGNPDLRWQDVYQHNVGVDITLFNEVLSITGNWYRKETKNFISDLGLTYSHGFAQYKENIGELRNEGMDWEVAVNLLRNKNIVWSVRGALSTNKNTIVSLSDEMRRQNEETVNNQGGNFVYLQYREGESMDAMYVLLSPGVDPATGEVLYVDRNGNVSTEVDLYAKVKVGEQVPKVNGRISTMFRYRNFSVNAGFEYRLGGQKLNNTLLDRVENANLRGNVDRRVLSERWEQPGDVTRYKALSVDINNTQANDRFVGDEATFIWRNLNVQYDFPRKLCGYLRMERLSVSASVQDLLYLSTIEQERGTAYPFAVQPTFSISCTF